MSSPYVYDFSKIEDDSERELAIITVRSWKLKAEIADRQIEGLTKYYESIYTTEPKPLCATRAKSDWEKRCARRNLERAHGFIIPPGEWDDDLDTYGLEEYPVELSPTLTALGYTAFVRRGRKWTWNGYVRVPDNHVVRTISNGNIHWFEYEAPPDLPRPLMNISFIKNGVVGFDHASDFDISPVFPSDNFWLNDHISKGYLKYADITKEIIKMAEYLQNLQARS